MKKSLKVIELNIEDFENGVNFMSIVDEPAIEMNFLYFADDKYNLTLSKFDIEKRIITGPALIPDKKIYRFDKKTNEEFYVYFTADTIEKIAQKFFKEHNQDQVNIQHDKKIDDAYIFESWIVRNSENDAANEIGYTVPAGTLMISMKIDNDEIWDKIKNGELKGFSIEGVFTGSFSKDFMNDNDDVYNLLLDILKSEKSDDDILTEIKNILNCE